jgi:hypothetical protein
MNEVPTFPHSIGLDSSCLVELIIIHSFSLFEIVFKKYGFEVKKTFFSNNFIFKLLSKVHFDNF